MGKKKMAWLFFVILATSAWVLGAVIQGGAETLKYKSYTYTIKEENIPVGDEEGHLVMFYERGGLFVFENGEVANFHMIGTGEAVKNGASLLYYDTVTFSDGSTIMERVQGTLGMGVPGVPSTGGFKKEIIKGTGRFEGIKGTGSGRTKYLPVEKWQPGVSGYGEGAYEYTLPPK
jgi:hypothetical protein